MKLLKTDLLSEALEKLKKAYFEANPEGPETETVPVFSCYGRILAEDVFADCDVPGFNRSTVDGYAVKSSDTAGAGESIPTFLKVVGEIEMGKNAAECGPAISSGECMYVPTGGMLPEGADAVVMIEFTEALGNGEIAVYDGLSPWRNVIIAGDDCEKGTLVLKRGRKLRPSDMGLLSAVGVTEIKAFKPWNVTIISTGDEIVKPAAKPALGQVRDVNTASLAGEAAELGFKVNETLLVKDDREGLKNAVRAAMKNSDLVLVSGGSSQGKKDATEAVIGELCSSGVLTHGISVKPGKPTIIGVDSPTKAVVIGLPGHPVAALVLMREIPGKLWYAATRNRTETKNGEPTNAAIGCQTADAATTVEGRMSINIAAAPGRRTFQLVRLERAVDGSLEVIPLLGKSGLISKMSQADGYIVIAEDDEGLNKGDKVKVHML